jgi:hypothetical protein
LITPSKKKNEFKIEKDESSDSDISEIMSPEPNFVLVPMAKGKLK